MRPGLRILLVPGTTTKRQIQEMIYNFGVHLEYKAAETESSFPSVAASLVVDPIQRLSAFSLNMSLLLPLLSLVPAIAEVTITTNIARATTTTVEIATTATTTSTATPVPTMVVKN